MIDYQYILKEFPLRLGPGDCGATCSLENTCCSLKPQLPLLPGEGAFLADNGYLVGWHRELESDVFPCPGREACPGDLRPIVCKQFPLSPGKGCLMVARSCPQFTCLEPDFIEQVHKLWWYILNNSKSAWEWVERVNAWAWEKEGRIPLWRVQGYARTVSTTRV